MDRFRLMLVTAMLLAVSILSWGTGDSYAQQESAGAKQADDPAAAKRKADAAIRARAQRDAAIKKRHDAQKYIQKVVEGQQSGAAASAPGNAGKGGSQ